MELRRTSFACEGGHLVSLLANESPRSAGGKGLTVRE